MPKPERVRYFPIPLDTEQPNLVMKFTPTDEGRIAYMATLYKPDQTKEILTEGICDTYQGALGIMHVKTVRAL